jgi:integrase
MARPSKPWFRASKDAWYITIDGKMVPLAVKGERNVKAAELAWHKLLAQAGTPKPDAPPLTVAEAVEAFLTDAESRVKPTTMDTYRMFLLPFVNVHGKRLATALTPTVAEAYSRKPSWSADTRASFLGVLVNAFRWNQKARLLLTNPLLGLQKPQKVSRGEAALLPEDGHAKLLAVAPSAFKLLLEVLHATGCRPGEAASITAQNFDPVAGLVRLTSHKTAHKTGRSRVIYLSPSVVALLLRQKEKYGTGPLLRNDAGRPWKKNTICKYIQRARDKAGVQAIAYGYRHTFATDALTNGVPDAQVAELLGHAGTAMLHRHYSHLGTKAEALRNALGRVR